MAHKVSTTVNLEPENIQKVEGLARKITMGNRSMLMNAIVACLDDKDPVVVNRLREFVENLVDVRIGGRIVG